MRAFASLLAASLLALASVDARAAQRAASLNLCTDELLLLLADPHEIVSLTHLSQDRLESPLWRAAGRFPANDGSILSLADDRPSLAIRMGSGPGDAPSLARRLGIRLITLPFPQSVRDVEHSIGIVAVAVGRRQAGTRLIARIEQLRQSARPGRIDAIWLGGGGQSLSATGLGADWMALAGLRQRSLPGDRLTVEQLLLRPPDLLLRSDYRSGQYSLEQRWLGQPWIAQRWRGRTVATDGRRWSCMGPLMIDEIERLRRVVRR